MADSGSHKSLFTPAYDRFLVLLRETRAKAGLTQKEAAGKMKRPQSFISKCESGERRVDVVELLAFCKAYEISAEGFVRKLRPR